MPSKSNHKTISYVLFALLSVLLVIMTALFVNELHKDKKSCGLSGNQLLNLLNLGNSTEIEDENEQEIDFTGRFALASSENFEEFLEELGVNYFTRIIAVKLKPEIEVIKNAENNYTMKTISTFKNSEITFKFGVKFEETTGDDREVVSTVVRNGNKWIQKQIGEDQEVTFIREFVQDPLTGDVTAMKTTGAVNDVAFIRVYDKIKQS